MSVESMKLDLQIEDFKRKVEQDIERRYHWKWQRAIWTVTVIVAIAALILR